MKELALQNSIFAHTHVLFLRGKSCECSKRIRISRHDRICRRVVADAARLRFPVEANVVVERKIVEEVLGGDATDAVASGAPMDEESPANRPLKINTDLALYRCRRARIKSGRCRNPKKKRGMMKEAEEGYRRVMVKDPTDGRSYVGLGRLLVQQKRFEEARKMYEDGCAATQGVNPYIWTAWANLEAKQGTPPRARKLYDAAVVADRSHGAAWHGWGMLEKVEQNFSAARDCWINGIDNAQGEPSAYLYQSLAVLASELGKVGEARQWFSEGTRTLKGANSHAMWQAWAKMEMELGNEAEVPGLFKQSLEVNPRSRYTYLTWATFEKRLGRVENARQLLQRGMEFNKTDPAIYQASAVLESEHGNMDKARELFERGCEVDPSHQQLWQAYGVMEFRAGNIERGRELFQQGIWAGPEHRNSAYIFHAWGVLESRMGNTSLARELYKCALKVDSKNQTVWDTWVAMEESIGAYDRADELRNICFQQRTQVVLPESFTTLKISQGRLGPFMGKISDWVQKFGEAKDTRVVDG